MRSLRLCGLLGPWLGQELQLQQVPGLPALESQGQAAVLVKGVLWRLRGCRSLGYPKSPRVLN